MQAVFLAVTTGIWGIAYAGTVIARNWPVSIGRVNIACAMFMASIVLLMNSPVLDPLRLSADDQVSRLNTGKIRPEDFDYAYLASLGRYGKSSLDALNSQEASAKPQAEIHYGSMIFTFKPTSISIQSRDKSLIGTIYGYFPPSESHSVRPVPAPPDYEIDGNIYRPQYVK